MTTAHVRTWWRLSLSEHPGAAVVPCQPSVAVRSPIAALSEWVEVFRIDPFPAGWTADRGVKLREVDLVVRVL